MTADEARHLNTLREAEVEAERNLINAVGARPGQMTDDAIGAAGEAFCTARNAVNDTCTQHGHHGVDVQAGPLGGVRESIPGDGPTGPRSHPGPTGVPGTAGATAVGAAPPQGAASGQLPPPPAGIPVRDNPQA